MVGSAGMSMLTSSADVVTMPSVPSVCWSGFAPRRPLFHADGSPPAGVRRRRGRPFGGAACGSAAPAQELAVCQCLGWVEHQYSCFGVGGHEGEGMELEDERFPQGGGRCDDDVLAGSGQVGGPALVVPDGVEGMDAGGAGCDEVWR